MTPPKLFSLDAGAELADRVAAALGQPLGAHEERTFVDGELKLRPLDDVEGADVYLLQSLYSDPPKLENGSSVNDKLVRLLFFIGALKDAGAARVNAVIPYLCYARKDRRTKPRDPLSSRYIASLLESLGTDCVITLDVHNLAAFENAFRCRTLHLPAQSLFVDFAEQQLKGDSNPLIVASPDLGGVKRAEAFRLALSERLGREIGHAFVEKYRNDNGGQLSGGTLVSRRVSGGSQVRDASVLIIDDLIASGGTISRAANALHSAGARRIFALATHGQFCGDALGKLRQLPLETIAVTNSLPQLRLPQAGADDRLRTIDCAPLLAQAIRRLHSGGPAAQLSG